MRNKKVVSMVVATSMIASLMSGGFSAFAATQTPRNGGEYNDIAQHWAENQIATWSQYEVVKGMEDGIFSPESTLTRAQLFALMNRILGNEEEALLTEFSDVNLQAWYAKDIAKAVAGGIAGGDGGGTMRPDAQITRQEVAVIFARVFGLDTTSESAIENLSDKNEIASWARGSVAAVIGAGFMKGTSESTFSPIKNTTRAEAVKTIDNAIVSYMYEAKTYEGDIKGNALINMSGVSLKGATVSGMLVIAPGAKNNITIDGTTVTGQVLVKGGGFSAKNAHFGSVVVKGDHAVLTIPKGTTIQNLIIEGSNTVVKGDGFIAYAKIEGKNATLETKPAHTVIKTGVNATIEGKKETASSINGSIGGGGGIGGDSGGGSEPTVTVSPDKDKIIASMTNITNGFSVKEVATQVTTNHKDHVEKASHPFSSMYCSVGDVDKIAATQGYLEKEVFMSGIANVYAFHPNGKNIPIVKTPNVDYTTRLLIHYPQSAEKFSGRVYVDILNASAGYDLEDVWRRSYNHMMETGDIYIGITSKSLTAQALKNFDSERYKDLDWLVDNNNSKSTEDGLVWDMLGQLGTMLQTAPEKLFDQDLAAKVKEGNVYLTGQSQSGFYLNAFLNGFYPYINNSLKGGSDIYNGYFNAVGATSTDLSTGNKFKDAGWPKTEEPLMVMMGEGEAYMRFFMNYYEALPDKNDADWKFRLYEVAGAPHADPTSAILPTNFDIARANTKTDAQGNPTGASRDVKNYTGNHVEGDVHLDEFVTGALVNLDKWARGQGAAPSASDKWLTADETGKALKKDAMGNAVGGLRSPLQDAPIATNYGVINNPPSAGGMPAYATEGSMVYLTKTQLDARYAGNGNAAKLAKYQEEFKTSAEKALKDGYITKTDYNKFIAYSQNVSIFENKKQAVLTAQQAVPTDVQDVTPVDMMHMLNSTKMSVGEKTADWNQKAPLWVPKITLNSDGTIQYGNEISAIKYTEKEYFVGGMANIYNLTSENVIGVKDGNLPYKNRMIIRTPVNQAQFTGKVYVDILNSSDKYDNESLWRRAYGMIMEEGAAYVGITSKPSAIAAMKKLDPARYAPLSWASPNTYLFSNYKLADEQTFIPSEMIGTDIGLVWDIVSQAGNLIQANGTASTKFFGANAAVDKVYLYGQSQSGFVMNTYFLFQDFLKANGAAATFDGFMNVVGTYPGNKINQSDTTAKPVNTEGGFYMPGALGVPVIYATSQMDFNPAFRRGNTNVINDGEDMYALYEMAGAPHSDPMAPVFPDNSVLQAMGYPTRDLFPQFDQKQVISDYNSNMFIQGLLGRLDEWAKNGATAPPAMPFITKKENGTVTGGLRSPQIDVPMADYYEKPIGTQFSTSGTMVPWTTRQIKEKYTTEQVYTTAFNSAIDALAAKGLIRATDVKYMKAYALEMSKKVSAQSIESPDKDNIIASMTNITNGFSVKTVETTVTTNHKDHVEKASHPFSSMYCSVGEVDKIAATQGYLEKEVFMSGTANVYGLSEQDINLPVIKTPNVDYTTRLLIHYPQSAEKFSGRVYVDILNASAGYDLEDVWRRSYNHMMENGDIYIGITAKSLTAQALKNFDSERYKDLDWLVNNDNPKSTEDGLVWDMLGQLGTMLQTAPEKMFDQDLAAKVQTGNVFLTGQSQSGFYVNTFLKVFYPYISTALTNGKPVFDGYFNAVGSSNTALSTGVSVVTKEWPVTAEPLIVMMGEGEAAMRLSMGYYPAVEDKNDDNWKFRLYEVAGAPHADPTSAILPTNFEIAKANTKTDAQGNLTGASRDLKGYTGNHVEGDVHLDEFVTGALVNLAKWVETATPAPNADAHWLTSNGKALKKDAMGNAMGGLRSPLQDAPIATNYGVINNPAGGYATEGSMVYLTKAQLDERYAGSGNAAKLAKYQEEFKTSADKALADGYITKTDYNKFIAYSQNVSIFENKVSAIKTTQTAVPTAVDKTPVDMETMFNSTAMSVSTLEKDKWNAKAPIWAQAITLDATDAHVEYVEREFFVSGTANLYNITSDNMLLVRDGNVPYTNRIIVRTPKNQEEFNGKVYVDVLNATSGFDSEALWRRANSMIMDTGAAYVGVTSKPMCIETLKRFNHRYNDLSWASPNTYIFSNYKKAQEGSFVPSDVPFTDIGLIYDILSQTGNLIKEQDNLLFGSNKSNTEIKTYLFGQSQSGFVVNTYAVFQKFLEEQNVATLPYDGLMTMVGTAQGPYRMNQSDKTFPINKDGEVSFGGQVYQMKYYVPSNLKTPFIVATTENDLSVAFRPDGDSNVVNTSAAKYAIYEMAGTPHSDDVSPTFPTKKYLTMAGITGDKAFEALEKENGTDINSNMFVKALLVALDKWAANATAPPTMDLITMQNNQVVVDDHGNAMGGLRSPQLDAPLYQYMKNGTMTAFTEGKMKELYATIDTYTTAFNTPLEALKTAGLLSASDVAFMEAYRDAKVIMLTSIGIPTSAPKMLIERMMPLAIEEEEEEDNKVEEETSSEENLDENTTTIVSTTEKEDTHGEKEVVLKDKKEMTTDEDA